MGIECQSVESLMNVISAGNGMGTPYQQAYKYQASCNPWDPLLLGRLYLYHNPLGMYSSNPQFSLACKYQELFVRSSPHSIFLDMTFLSPSHTGQGKIFLEHMYQELFALQFWDPTFQDKPFLFPSRILLVQIFG